MEAPHLVALETWAHRVPSAAGHWLKIKNPQKTTEKDLLVLIPTFREVDNGNCSKYEKSLNQVLLATVMELTVNFQPF